MSSNRVFVMTRAGWRSVNWKVLSDGLLAMHKYGGLGGSSIHSWIGFDRQNATKNFSKRTEWVVDGNVDIWIEYLGCSLTTSPVYRDGSATQSTKYFLSQIKICVSIFHCQHIAIFGECIVIGLVFVLGDMMQSGSKSVPVIIGAMTFA